MASAFIPATVINNQQWAENLFTLTLDTELQPFKAGQFVRLQLSVDGEQIAKPYSLVNPPQQASAEVLYNTVPDGVMSHGFTQCICIFILNQQAVLTFYYNLTRPCRAISRHDRTWKPS